jgi:carbon monoxide dehydrogenase subunit G
MIHIEISTQIARTRAEVFDFLTDLDNLKRWQTGVIQTKSLMEGPVRVGYQFTETAKVGPWTLNTVSTVTDLKTNERFAFQVKSAGPLDCDVQFDLQPVAGGTRLTITGAGRLKGMWRLLQPMLVRELRKETQTELATIKLLLEASAAVPSGSAI